MSQKKHSLTETKLSLWIGWKSPLLTLKPTKTIPTRNFWEKWNPVVRNGTFQNPFSQWGCVSAAQEQQGLSNAPGTAERVSFAECPELLLHRGTFPGHPAIPQTRPAGASIQGKPLQKLCCSPKAPPWQWQHPAAGHTPCHSEMDGEIQGKLAEFGAIDSLFIWEVFLSW